MEKIDVSKEVKKSINEAQYALNEIRRSAFFYNRPFFEDKVLREKFDNLMKAWDELNFELREEYKPQ